MTAEDRAGIVASLEEFDALDKLEREGPIPGRITWMRCARRLAALFREQADPYPVESAQAGIVARLDVALGGIRQAKGEGNHRLLLQVGEVLRDAQAEIRRLEQELTDTEHGFLDQICLYNEMRRDRDKEKARADALQRAMDELAANGIIVREGE